MTARARHTRAELVRFIKAADETGKVLVQTPMGIAFVDPAMLPQHAPAETGVNTCDKAFGVQS